MASRPLPPFLPENEAAFFEHVREFPAQWYKYCSEIYEYSDKIDQHLIDTRTDLDQSRRDNAELRANETDLKQELAS
ncbi:hypothetical protein B0A49_07322, partial [Cryomyces minteri]